MHYLYVDGEVSHENVWKIAIRKAILCIQFVLLSVKEEWQFIFESLVSSVE